VRMELGQEGWLKQPVAKVRGPIMAGDQGSRQVTNVARYH
jgi:hypothetical protein